MIDETEYPVTRSNPDFYTNLVKRFLWLPTWRIGIAGPRALDSQELNIASQQLSHVLAKLATELGLARKKQAPLETIDNTDAGKSPIFILTSSLAIGADRLAMSPEIRACLQDKVRLEYAAVLPFVLEDCKNGMYEESRSKTQNNQDWLSLNHYVQQIKGQQQSRLIELSGDILSADSRDKAHFNSAVTLVNNIDLLIVVTKNNPPLSPSHHLAGTNTTARLAQEVGHPVIQISLDADEPKPEAFMPAEALLIR